MGSTPTVLTADERIALINVKIERAQKHIRDLHDEIKAFRISKPYEVTKKVDPQTGKTGQYLMRLDPIPAHFSCIAGDAIQNLRSALDHLAQHLWMIGTGNFTPTPHLIFPIGNDAQDFKSRFGGKPQSFRQDAKDALFDLQPYFRGKGHDIWVLHSLNNIDKHRLILTVAAATGGLTINTGMLGEAMEKSLGLPSGSFPSVSATFFPAVPTILKVGDEMVHHIHGFASNFDPEKDGEFHFYVTFNEPQIFQGGALFEKLQHLADLVSSTVASFKPCLS